MSPNTVTYTIEFVNKIDKALIGNGVYVLQKNASEVIFYDTYVMDDEWTDMNPDTVVQEPQQYLLDDDYLVVLSQFDGIPEILAYDADKKTLLLDIKIEEAKSSSAKLLQVADDVLYISVVNQESGISIYRISLEDGSREEIYNISSPYYINQFCVSMTNDYLTYVYRDKEKNLDRIGFYNVRSGETKLFDFPKDDPERISVPVYYPELKEIVVSDKEDVFVINVESNDIKQLRLSSNWSGANVVEHNKEGNRWIIADLTHVLVFDSDWNQEMDLQTNGRAAVGAAFYKEGTSSEQILVVFDDGSFYRYDGETGDFIGKTEVEMYYNTFKEATLTIDEEQGLIFIQTGNITDLLETESWVEVAVVWNSLGYHKPTDTFFAFSFTGAVDFHIGYFRHYTLQELKDKAYRILKGSEMSEEQKMRYGIS
ncbi:MAG TPA: hypothetical protein DEO39_03660 [Clostridiales bacterium]|nr:hypothetical protein [Clostridiales bacterium]